MNNGNGRSTQAIILAAVVGLVVGCTGGENASPSTSPRPTEGRHGAFAYRVLWNETSKTIGGDQKLEAQGIYVNGEFQVANIGKSPQKYVADYQRLVDRQGCEYSPDIRAMTLAWGDYFRNEVDINPGNTFPDELAFDVPAVTRMNDYVITLHDAPHSAGVTVALKNCPSERCE